jgi:hypothetical protein
MIRYGCKWGWGRDPAYLRPNPQRYTCPLKIRFRTRWFVWYIFWIQWEKQTLVSPRRQVTLIESIRLTLDCVLTFRNLFSITQLYPCYWGIISLLQAFAMSTIRVLSSWIMLTDDFIRDSFWEQMNQTLLCHFREKAPKMLSIHNTGKRQLRCYAKTKRKTKSSWLLYFRDLSSFHIK